ncbi:uncharacterized protein LOC135144630 isoform X1 [Zophobas morio]|uniref:uncharacterized protein LOC135144630 isoform X1 n=1 Tax=Zophobas morio TaxID=2755281 RepID=UPI003083EAFA
MTRIHSTYLFCLLLYLKVSTIKCDDPTTMAPTEPIPSTVPSQSTATPISTTTPTSITQTTTTSISSTTPTSITSQTPTTQTSASASTTTQVSSTTTTSTSTTSTTSQAPTTTTTATTPTTTTTIPTTESTVINLVRSFTWTDCQGANPEIFNVTPGYFISATVSDVSISNGNYLLIEGGNSRIDGATDGRVFANTVKGPISYLFKTHMVYAYCENTRQDDENPDDPPWANFTIKFQRVGEGTSTVPTTVSTTTLTVPTTQKDDSIFITVNMTGRNYLEYNNASVKQAFQECVASISFEYCRINNIELSPNITSEYVMISKITQCPYNWPESTTCTQITFKVPIFYDSSNWDGYQLNTEHLEKIWYQKDQLDIHGCFVNNSFEDYDEPEFELAITWWAIGISLVIVAFVALLWFMRLFSSRVKTALKKRQNQRRNSDTVSIMSRKTNSVSSLTPHYLQDHQDISTPKIFDI